jgi:hypothetical protein
VWRRPFLGVPVWVWATALLASLLVMGPALAPGSLLNLDLVLVPDPPLPRGFWGLGPELPRRLPMWVPIVWLSTILGGAAVGKIVMVLGITVAFAGMYRLTARWGAITALGASVLFALSPLVLTRLAVGHLYLVWTMAVMPWALDDLLHPARSRRRTFLWCAAFAFMGIYGGAVGGALLLAGLIVSKGRRLPSILGLYLLAQLPWLVPLAVVSRSTTAIADAAAFPTSVKGVAGIGELLAGHGFWNPPFQVGGYGHWYWAVLGFVLFLLAAIGTADLPQRWRLPLVILAAIGLVASASSGISGLSGAVVRISQTPLGAPFRETQRLLAFSVFWMAPSAALGARRIVLHLRATTALPTVVTRAVLAVPLVLGLALAAPGFWGVGGQLRAYDFPPEWAAARDIVRAEPGTVVAFPWYQYFTFDVADNRLVLNTVPLYFGGDVIASSDPGIATEDNARPHERGDAREDVVTSLISPLQQGRPISADLARLGVRWVVLMKDVDWPLYEKGLAADPGLVLRTSGDRLALYEVTGWKGAVVDDAGAAVPSEQLIGPFERVDASGPARAAIPASGGWLRGFTPAARSSDGIVALPAGDGLLWYWPVLLVAVGDVIWVLAVLLCASGKHPERHQTKHDALNDD